MGGEGAEFDGCPILSNYFAGEEFLRLSAQAKSEDVSLYFAELCLDCVELGVTKLSILQG